MIGVVVDIDEYVVVDVDGYKDSWMTSKNQNQLASKQVTTLPTILEYFSQLSFVHIVQRWSHKNRQ